MTKIKKWRIIIIIFFIIISFFSIYYYRRKKRLKELYVYFYYPGSCFHKIRLNYSFIFYIYSDTSKFPKDKEDLINMYSKYLHLSPEDNISESREDLSKYNYEKFRINGENIYVLSYENIFKKYGFKYDIKIAWDDYGIFRSEYCGDIPILKNGKLIPEPIEKHLDLDKNKTD